MLVPVQCTAYYGERGREERKRGSEDVRKEAGNKYKKENI